MYILKKTSNIYSYSFAQHYCVSMANWRFSEHSLNGETLLWRYDYAKKLLSSNIFHLAAQNAENAKSFDFASQKSQRKVNGKRQNAPKEESTRRQWDKLSGNKPERES